MFLVIFALLGFAPMLALLAYLRRLRNVHVTREALRRTEAFWAARAASGAPALRPRP